MRNAIILHGTGCNPKSYWFPYLTHELRARGFDVWVPLLPDAERPTLKTALPFVLKHGKFTKDTVIIGHSAGSPLILAVLENINIKIHKAILVSGYARQKGKVKDDPILQNKYNWKKIQSNAKEFYFINSDNDPWGCTDIEGRYMLDHLDGTLIIKKGEGHMGSDTFHQPYKEFPLLVKLVEL